MLIKMQVLSDVNSVILLALGLNLACEIKVKIGKLLMYTLVSSIFNVLQRVVSVCCLSYKVLWKSQYLAGVSLHQESLYMVLCCGPPQLAFLLSINGEEFLFQLR